MSDQNDEINELPDFVAPLGKFSTRRSSIIFGAKLIEKWQEKDDSAAASQNKAKETKEQAIDDGNKKPGQISMASFEEYVPDNLNKALIYGPDMDEEAAPAKMSVDDMTEVLFECINEESLRREAAVSVPPPKKGMRRGSVQVIRPESSSVLEDAKKMTDMVNKIVSQAGDKDAKRKLCARQIANEMSSFIPEDMKTVLDLDENFIEEEE